MGLRELIILLLGFVAIGVILQGFYVAIRARRNQIRVAIDNNIPEDFDLEDIELAELPSGGARRVPRYFDVGNENAENPTAIDENAQDIDILADELDQEEREDVFGLGVPESVDSVTGPFEEFNGFRDNSPLAMKCSENLSGAGSDFSDRFVEKEYPGVGREEGFDNLEAHEHCSEQQSDDNKDEYESSVDVYDDGFSDDIRRYAKCADNADYFLEEGTNQGAEKIDNSDLLYEKEEYDEIFSDDYLDNTSEYAGPGREENERYQSDRSEGESSPVADADTAGEVAFEDELEEFSMTAGERIGYEQRLEQESFDSGFQENGGYGSIEPPPREHVKPSRVKALLEFLKRGKSIESTQATPDSEDVLGEGYMGEGKASQEAEIIDELEDFFDDQNPSDELITNAHEEFEVFDKGNGASAQFISDNVARFEVTARSDAVTTRGTGDNRLRKQDLLHSSEVLVVNVMSREGDEFSGDDLLKSLVDNGLVFGEMNIFHLYASQDNEDLVLFSVANILRPGTFDLYNMHEFSTIGISLFLSLPTGVNNLEAFENMIRSAKRICETLDGLLKDDHRNFMTAQTIEHYRQRIRDFELLQLKTGVSRA